MHGEQIVEVPLELGRLGTFDNPAAAFYDRYVTDRAALKRQRHVPSMRAGRSQATGRANFPSGGAGMQGLSPRRAIATRLIACGTLEIMIPLAEYEEYARFVDDVVRVLAEELGLQLEKRGSAT
jgi:hypothetical protein